MDKAGAQKLLNEWIDSDSLRLHSNMVAQAMEAYANKLGKSEKETLDWYLAGLLHDLDWEKKPDEHPNYALASILPEYSLSNNVLEAIRAHAPGRTGKHPETEIERYLFACDEISGFMYAVSLMRPEGFNGMKPKSVKKKLKDKRFAANVSRQDIQEGLELIDTTFEDHIIFLVEVFK